MELKQAGDLLATLSDMEQELRYTSANCENEAQRTERVSLLQDQYRLARSIAVLMNSYAEAVSTKMEQSSSTST